MNDILVLEIFVFTEDRSQDLNFGNLQVMWKDPDFFQNGIENYILFFELIKLEFEH